MTTAHGDEEAGSTTSPTLKLGGAAAQELASELSVSVIEGPDLGVPAATSRGPLLIVGRADGADLRLSDPAVSAFHLELTSLPNGIDARDLGSRNGTFTKDGVRLLHAVLPMQCTLQVGTTTLMIERVPAEPNVVAVASPPPAPSPASPRAATTATASFGRMRASSSLMRSLFAVLARLAPTEISVLIEGATGTGKELVAQGIHQASHRSAGPFVVLDCTSIPRSIAESVLFGHERGAFTGADTERAGVFEAADGGTVFIDEIGDLPLELQPKLLRVLEKREVVRVGQSSSEPPRPISVRVLTATWRDLRKMVNAGTFREDLYFRIAQARTGIPPLSDRIEDVPTLVYYFLQNLPASVPAARMIARDALEELKRRPWPGNVRELRSMVERMAMLAQGESITLAELGFERILSGEREHAPTPGAAALNAASATSDQPVAGGDDADANANANAPLPNFKSAKRSLVEDFERGYFALLLAKAGDNLTRASAISGIERHHLRDLLRKHGLRGS